jgi:fibronectin type 3 domain-containing protein
MKGGVASFWWFETNHPVDSVTGLCWQPWWDETVFGPTYDSWRQWADLTPVGGDRVQVNKGGGGMGLSDIAFDNSGTGMVTLVVLNQGADQYIDVSVTGESMSQIDYYHTTETESYTLVSSVTPVPSQESFLVEAESLNMFVITYGPGDTNPPAPPTNLSATAGDAQVILNWGDNTEPDLDGYNVYRDTTSGGPYTQIATDVATSDYTDNSVSNGTTYYYVVTAVDTSSNESGYSNEDSATPDVGAGQTPYTSHQIPGTIEAEDYDYGGEAIAYHDNDGGNSGGAYRSDDVDIESCGEGGYNVGWINAGEWIEYTVENISAGTYNIEVRVASNTAGGSLHIEFDGQDVTGTISFGATGGWQNWISVYVNDVNLSAGQQVMRVAMDSLGWNLNWVKFEAVDTTPPSAPTGLVATAGDAQVSLDWADNNEPDLAGYNVFRATTSGGGYSQLNGSLLTGSDYTDNTVSNGTTYYYVVTAVDTSSNESGYSNEASATPTDTTPPADPTGLAATPGDATVSLDWNDNGEGDLDGYNVYRSTTQGDGYSRLNGPLLSSSDYTDNTVSNDTTYYYVVTAVDTSSNESGYSNEASATPTAGGGVVFSDSFENGEWNGLWTEDSQMDWKDSAQRAVDGSYSAEVDGSASDATLTSILIDLQGKTNVTVTFSWLIEKGLDSGEYLAFDVSTNGGSSWVQKAILQGNVDQENTWHNANIDITGISGGFKIRFRGKMSRSNEDADVDMVEVLAW